VACRLCFSLCLPRLAPVSSSVFGHFLMLSACFVFGSFGLRSPFRSCFHDSLSTPSPSFADGVFHLWQVPSPMLMLVPPSLCRLIPHHTLILLYHLFPRLSVLLFLLASFLSSSTFPRFSWSVLHVANWPLAFDVPNVQLTLSAIKIGRSCCVPPTQLVPTHISHHSDTNSRFTQLTSSALTRCIGSTIVFINSTRSQLLTIPPSISFISERHLIQTFNHSLAVR
jgi:hypothetical protein